MGLFGKLFKKKDDFDLGAPPDFSQPIGNDPLGGKDPLGSGYGQPIGNDPLASDPFGATRSATQSPLTGQDSAFGHDVFSSGQPTNADNARSYAQQLGGSAIPGQQQSATYAGAITGHEAQLILERLDTIKAELDSIKQRMIHVERYMESAEQKAGQRKYF